MLESLTLFVDDASELLQQLLTIQKLFFQLWLQQTKMFLHLDLLLQHKYKYAAWWHRTMSPVHYQHFET